MRNRPDRADMVVRLGFSFLTAAQLASGKRKTKAETKRGDLRPETGNLNYLQ
jgi:hypothetical protein